MIHRIRQWLSTAALHVGVLLAAVFVWKRAKTNAERAAVEAERQRIIEHTQGIRKQRQDSANEIEAAHATIDDDDLMQRMRDQASD